MRKLGNTLYYPCRKPERMTVAGEWTDSAATIQSRDWLGWHPASSPAPCWCWNSVAAKEFSLLSPHCDLLWLLGRSVYRNLPRMRINSGARTCPACLLVWEQRRAHCLSCPPFSATPSCHLLGLPFNHISALPCRLSWTQAFSAPLTSPVTCEWDHAGCVPLSLTLIKALSSQPVWSQSSSYILLHLCIRSSSERPFVNWIRLHWV